MCHGRGQLAKKAKKRGPGPGRVPGKRDSGFSAPRASGRGTWSSRSTRRWGIALAHALRDPRRARRRGPARVVRRNVPRGRRHARRRSRRRRTRWARRECRPHARGRGGERSRDRHSDSITLRSLPRARSPSSACRWARQERRSRARPPQGLGGRGRPAWEAVLAAGRKEPIFAGMTGPTAGDPGERAGKAVQVVPNGADELRPRGGYPRGAARSAGNRSRCSILSRSILGRSSSGRRPCNALAPSSARAPNRLSPRRRPAVPTPRWPTCSSRVGRASRVRAGSSSPTATRRPSGGSFGPASVKASSWSWPRPRACPSRACRSPCRRRRRSRRRGAPRPLPGRPPRA